jgi:hypothetical protein
MIKTQDLGSELRSGRGGQTRPTTDAGRLAGDPVAIRKGRIETPNARARAKAARQSKTHAWGSPSSGPVRSAPDRASYSLADADRGRAGAASPLRTGGLDFSPPERRQR